MQMPIKEEIAEFKFLKKYPIQYLSPQDMHILKTLIIFAGHPTPCKVNIFEFISFFDEDTYRCFHEHPNAMRPLSGEKVPENSMETFKKVIAKRIAPFQKAEYFLRILEKEKFIKSIVFPSRKNWGTILSELKNVLRNSSLEDIFESAIFPKNEKLEIEIKFREEGTKKIKNWLSDYLNIFTDNKLSTFLVKFYADSPISKSFYPYGKSVAFFNEVFSEDYAIRESTTIEIDLDMLDKHWQKITGKNSIFQLPQLRPIESLLAMEKEGCLEVIGIFLNRITVKLEEALKAEIETGLRQVEEANGGRVTYPEGTRDVGRAPYISAVTRTQSLSESPMVKDENGAGFLVMKRGSIPIGRITTRKYRFLEYLLPLGTMKTIDEVFNAIRTDAEKMDSSLNATAENKRKVIRNTKIEIYKQLAKNGVVRGLQISIRKSGVQICRRKYSSM